MKNEARNNQFKKTELTVRSENEIRDENYILEKLGYYRIISDIWLEDYGYFEDWWVNPKYINIEEFLYLQCSMIHPTEIPFK